MELAKQVFEAAQGQGKIGEVQISNLTGLNKSKIKEAKAWLKEKDLIESFRGRGGYFRVIDDAVFPEIIEDTMTAAEKRAASIQEKKELTAEQERRRSEMESVRLYVEGLTEAAGCDKVEVQFSQEGIYYAWIWRDGYADGYRVYFEDIERN